jgi:hypothetical protein
MNLWAPAARRLLAAAALGSAAALAAGCGTSSSSGAGSPQHTVTVTVTPSSGGSGTQAPSPTATASPGVAECATSDLSVRVGASNGAAGTIYYSLDFTNASASSCFVQGYPGVSLVTAGSSSGSQIGADAKRVPVVTPKQIVLAPGQTANAQLGVAVAQNFPTSSCHPVTAHWLKVFPPDQTVAAYAPFTTQTCASTAEPTMRIAALTAGA